jgi:hypothetical protein
MTKYCSGRPALLIKTNIFTKQQAPSEAWWRVEGLGLKCPAYPDLPAVVLQYIYRPPGIMTGTYQGHNYTEGHLLVKF